MNGINWCSVSEESRRWDAGKTLRLRSGLGQLLASHFQRTFHRQRDKSGPPRVDLAMAMQEHAGYKSYLRLQDEDDLAALQRGVDELYEKVQENVYMNLSRWEGYCDTLESSLPISQGDADPDTTGADAEGDGTSSGTSLLTSSDDDGPVNDGDGDGAPFTEEEEVAFDYWRKRLAAAERKSSEIDGEIQSLERALKALEAAGTVGGRGADAAATTKLSKVFEDVVKPAILLENQLKQRQKAATPPDHDSDARSPWGPEEQDLEDVPDGLVQDPDVEEEDAVNPDSLELTSMLSLAQVE